jgi:hypothetical protein
MTLNIEGGCAQGIERTLTIQLDANVQLVVAHLHQSVLELVSTNIDIGECDSLDLARGNLNESDAEDVILVVLQVAEHIPSQNDVALLNAHDGISVVNLVSKGSSCRVADVRDYLQDVGSELAAQTVIENSRRNDLTIKSIAFPEESNLVWSNLVCITNFNVIECIFDKFDIYVHLFLGSKTFEVVVDKFAHTINDELNH